MHKSLLVIKIENLDEISAEINIHNEENILKNIKFYLNIFMYISFIG